VAAIFRRRHGLPSRNSKKEALAAGRHDNGPPGLRWAVELVYLETKGSMTMTISPFLTASDPKVPQPTERKAWTCMDG
jgi:hypothetical protein